METMCYGNYAAASSSVAALLTENESFTFRLMFIVFFFGLILLVCYFIYPKLPKKAGGDEESGEPLSRAIILLEEGKLGEGYGYGGSTTEVCVICLEDFHKNDQVRVLVRCRHVYHVECIDSWCLYKLACPVCRAPFRLFGDW